MDGKILQMAQAWFTDYGLKTKIEKDRAMYMVVGDLHVRIHESEIAYRAECWADLLSQMD